MAEENLALARPVGKRTNATEQYLLSVIQGRRGVSAALIRAFLTLLAPLYCLGLEIFLLPYYAGIRKRTRLQCPVICVGNLTTGGTGKTPMTQFVCRKLLELGYQPVILSRGYGGENEYGCAVASNKSTVLLNASQAGDEAFLLAGSLLGVPVIVGKDRRITGALALKMFAPDVIVMDDGMQFWQLHRDLDIVLLNVFEPFGNGKTFPAGLLREPKSHLRRAGAIVLTGVERVSATLLKQTETHARRYNNKAAQFLSPLQPVRLLSVADKVEYSLNWLTSKRVASVCAIGNPKSFEAMLQSLGAVLTIRQQYRDHSAITDIELLPLYQAVIENSVELIVTTEKDGVKVDFSRSPVPVLELCVEMRPSPEPEFIACLQSVLS